MARSRNIKPSFFTNETLSEVPALGRILFAGLWTVADREGRLEDRPRKLKVELLPYDECDTDALLSCLQSKGFITRYEVAGNKYIQVLNFTKHQNPHLKEAASVIPAQESTGNSETSTGESGTSPALTLNPITLTLNPLPRVEVADAPPKPQTTKGMRLEAFLEQHGLEATCKDWGEWSLGIGMTIQQINDEMAKFRDYWKAVSGGKGCKADWPATWRNWSRRALETIRKEEQRNAVFKNRYAK